MSEFLSNSSEKDYWGLGPLTYPKSIERANQVINQIESDPIFLLDPKNPNQLADTNPRHRFNALKQLMEIYAPRDSEGNSVFVHHSELRGKEIELVTSGDSIQFKSREKIGEVWLTQHMYKATERSVKKDRAVELYVNEAAVTIIREIHQIEAQRVREVISQTEFDN